MLPRAARLITPWLSKSLTKCTVFQKNHYFLNNSQKLTDFDNFSRQNPEEFDTSQYAFVHLACKK